jgi:AP endonuclease-2
MVIPLNILIVFYKLCWMLHPILLINLCILGVATFCRVTSAFSSQEVALPVAAEEGFAGLQGSAKDSETIGDFVLQMPVEEEGLGEITREELVRLDNEGRCIITDHGHFGKPLLALKGGLYDFHVIRQYFFVTSDLFSVCDDVYRTICVVLFNLYGPAIGEDDEERVRFKLLFYKILQVFMYISVSILLVVRSC